MLRFGEPSEFGIREGRIRKLYIADAYGKAVLNYDRGWGLRPQTTVTKALLEAILVKFNESVRPTADACSRTSLKKCLSSRFAPGSALGLRLQKYTTV